MSLQARTFLNFIAGALAGILTWVLVDLTGWFRDVLDSSLVSPDSIKYLLIGGIFGLLLGLLLSVVDAISLNTDKRFGLLLLQSAGIGFAGGFVGLAIGQEVYGAISPSEHFAKSIFDIVGRSLGWAIIGSIIGASSGLARRSFKIAKQGAFGGLIGGATGGACFKLTVGLFGAIPGAVQLGRLVAFIITGALIGFFVGLVQTLMKQAWIRVVLGKNEGAEYVLAKPITIIGRSELADIPLYGDASVAPEHAAIESIPSQNRHRLRHVAPAIGRNGTPYQPTSVNGQETTSEQWLTDGDSIRVGNKTLVFYEKASRGSRIHPSSSIGAAAANRPVQTMTHVPPQSFTIPDTLLNEVSSVAPVASAAAPQVGPSFGAGSRLICLQGPYAGQAFALSHEPMTIGRANACDVPLVADSSVSRTHARLSYSSGSHIITDGGAANGIIVNGTRIETDRALNSGDVIRLGETVLRYE